jgi:hypothetical protein
VQQAPLGQALQLCGKRANDPLRHTRVVLARKVREATSFADHQPAELHRLRLDHGVDVPPRECAQVVFERVRLAQSGGDRLDEYVDPADVAADELREQLLLVSEMGVHGLLRDAG